MPLDTVATTSTDLKTPVEMLYKWELEIPNNVYLRQPLNNEIRDLTWHAVATQARKVAAQLRALDLEPGSRICIFSKNCAEWFITDLGIMLAGHVSVPIFAS